MIADTPTAIIDGRIYRIGDSVLEPPDFDKATGFKVARIVPGACFLEKESVTVKVTMKANKDNKSN